ncbi:hypothetical protein M0L20_18895 [Spirosoma sp. RP8]|uniref:Uncharacterized protein n=1 Tax=Spirosoma liriopis TaxID=2937440 RepID=A0ABT0HQM4_9BACT|nr:hypothetical protein [Spirosoma liriopis]MCK8493943.1 hypothetical protein [Spirosoma liriopis]
MQFYTRFLCYDSPDRQTTTQIHPDIPTDVLPDYGYNQLVRVGRVTDAPATWPCYVVAHITHLQQIDDPGGDGSKALLFNVFLARYEQWPQFYLPQMALGPLELTQ